MELQVFNSTEFGSVRTATIPAYALWQKAEDRDSCSW